jgi:hypothetical protein
MPVAADVEPRPFAAGLRRARLGSICPHNPHVVGANPAAQAGMCTEIDNGMSLMRDWPYWMFLFEAFLLLLSTLGDHDPDRKMVTESVRIDVFTRGTPG